MSILSWTYIMVGLSFALYIGIAIWSRVSSTKDFYVAGTGVSPFANGLATAADWMSAASFLSMAGLIAFSGRDGSRYLIGWTGGYVLLALLLAPYLRKFGKFTVPDFVGDRYYSNTARVVALVCAIFVSFTYVAGQMRGVGVVFSRFLEVDISTGVIIGMVIVFLYAVMGGMKGITYTQVAQYCVLIFAFMVPAFFISFMLTNNPIPQLGFGSDLTAEPGTHLLQKLDSVLTEFGFQKYTEGRLGKIDLLCITAALMCGTAGLPHVIVRFFTVPRVADARKSVGYALLFIAILYTTAPAVAAFARMNMFYTIQNVEYSAVPNWFKTYEKIGLIQYADKNNDGRIAYTGDPATNEIVKFDKDIMVLANPEIAGLPNWVVGLVAAGGLAAALSTAAGLLLVISTSIAHDLLKRCLLPGIREKQELFYARVAAGGAVIISGYFGVNPPGFVGQVVAFAFGLAAASFFPAIILGIFYTRMNKEAAIAGMLTGIIFTAGYIVFFVFVRKDLNNVDHWLFGISPEGIGTLGMLLNLAVSLIVCHISPPPPQDIRELVMNIRVPRA
jgi:cation/acetate symporter